MERGIGGSAPNVLESTISARGLSTVLCQQGQRCSGPIEINESKEEQEEKEEELISQVRI